MSVIILDGFDLYNGTGANTGLQAKWSAVFAISGNAPTASLQTGRFADQCLRLANSTSAYGAVSRTLPATYTSMTVGFAFRISNLVSVTSLGSFMQLREGATYHVHLGLDTNGKISAYRASSSTAGTSLGISASQVVFNATWHYIEVETVISDTVGRVTVYVDGVQALNLTSQDTRNGGTGVIDTLNLTNQCANLGATNWEFDDLYFLDAATKLGERRVETKRPNADTAQKDFTASTGTDNYAMVDDTTANGDTDYVQASTVNNTDRYTHGGLSSTPTTMDAVQVTAFAEKTDATARSIALQVKSGSTTSDGSNFSLASSYGKYERILATDPDTSAAWTASGVNNLAFGPKVTV